MNGKTETDFAKGFPRPSCLDLRTILVDQNLVFGITEGGMPELCPLAVCILRQLGAQIGGVKASRPSCSLQ